MALVKSVCRAMEHIAPLRLAEKWDNVGLLLEAPGTRKNARRVLLTIDVTTEVADEAIASEACCIVSYHPTIFKPISSLTLAQPKQASLLRLAQANVSLFVPHTSLDSVHGGINDWLAAGVLTNAAGVKEEGEVTFIGPAYEDLGGQGRIVTFAQPVSMEDVQGRVKRHLSLENIQVAYPHSSHPSSPTVRTVAICAGAGGSMFGDIKADLYFTGEMQHHEVLAAVAQGTNVILCGHTNTERGYLPTLAQKLRQTFQDFASSESDTEHASVLRSLEVVISQKDKHPLQIV